MQSDQTERKPVQVRVTAFISLAEHRALKAHGAMTGVGVQEIAAQSIREWLAVRGVTIPQPNQPADQSKGE
jgi:hypothetical protein